MVSDREQAKQSASNEEDSDPELKQVLDNAVNYRLELLKEENRHKFESAKGERGRLGWLLGDVNHAPTFIAFLAVIFGLFNRYRVLNCRLAAAGRQRILGQAV